jgi:monoterpene epsilon-lactone hydrolase
MSRTNRMILTLLKWAKARKVLARSFRDPPRDTGSLDLKKFKASLQPQAWNVDGFKVVTLTGQPDAKIHVVFLHGGGYILEANPFHRQLAQKLAGDHGLAVSLVDYPKSPEHSFRTTHAVLNKTYAELRERYPGQEICLLGDSAGGGLALAFLQSLRDREVTPLPPRTTLISPWLDISMSHPQVPNYKERDFILALDALDYAAELYSGGKDLLQPLLSPLFGDLSNLGRIQLIFGSEEIFVPDCRALIEKIQDAPGTEVDWEVGPGLIHDWPIFPFPESRAIINKIARFLLAG